MLALAAGPALAAEPLLWFDAGRPTPRRAKPRTSWPPPPTRAWTRRTTRPPRSAAADEALQGPALPEAEQAQLDSALTAALQRYLTDRHSGRVDPRQIHAKFDVPRHDAARHRRFPARGGGRAPRGRGASGEAEPRLPMYASLRQALARYRALADHPAWQAPLPPLPGRKLVPGQAWAGLPLLARRLEAVGDLPAGTPVPERFDGRW